MKNAKDKARQKKLRDSLMKSAPEIMTKKYWPPYSFQETPIHLEPQYDPPQPSEKITWLSMIKEAMSKHPGETMESLQGCTLNDEELELERPIYFQKPWGSEEPKGFTLWTSNRVYFPAMYDGYEWVESAPRNPCNERLSHVGG